MLYLWQFCTDNGQSNVEIRRRKQAKTKGKKKKEEMTQNQKHENYGLYITQNTYTMKWHTFKREDAERYWTGKDCKQGIGDTPQKALSAYKY